MADLFSTHAAAGGADADVDSDNGKMLDLGSKISLPESHARNEQKGFPMTNLFIGDSRLGCKSDTDEQIIIHIEFKEFVRVRVICCLDKARICWCITHRHGFVVSFRVSPLHRPYHADNNNCSVDPVDQTDRIQQWLGS
jgi:hypothetical protein